MKGTKIKLEFVIPDESPQKEIIAQKFRELMDALKEEKTKCPNHINKNAGAI